MLLLKSHSNRVGVRSARSNTVGSDPRAQIGCVLGRYDDCHTIVYSPLCDLVPNNYRDLIVQHGLKLGLNVVIVLFIEAHNSKLLAGQWWSHGFWVRSSCRYMLLVGWAVGRLSY